MHSQDAVRDEQTKRFEYLNYLYQNWRQVPSGQMQAVDAREVNVALQVDEQRADRIHEYLEQRGLLEYIGGGSAVGDNPVWESTMWNRRCSHQMSPRFTSRRSMFSISER
jgi:hypothetical protein